MTVILIVFDAPSAGACETYRPRAAIDFGLRDLLQSRPDRAEVIQR